VITRNRQGPPPPVQTAAERSRRRQQAREIPSGDGGPPAPRRRRPTSAWRAFAIAVVGVAIGLLLDAPGLHKSAFNQPAGWERTVALGFSGGLERVSHTVYLDRARSALKSALGRSHDDTIDTNVDIPIAAAPPAAASGSSHQTPTAAAGAGDAQSSPPQKLAFSPSHPLRLWIAGDSLVISPGYALLNAVEHARSIRSVGGVDGQIATGLERPDVFNWFTTIREELKKLKPSVVVLSFGGNDDKGYMTGLPQGVSVTQFGDGAWAQEYGRRVGGVLDLISRAGAYTIWIGLPFTRDPAQSARFERINAIVAEQIEKRPATAAFVQTDLLLAGKNGGYAQYLTLDSGQTVDARAPDGVHLSTGGGQIVAQKIVEQLYKVFDLTSWRHRSSTVAASG
jgi:uncharacterized protein